MKRRHFIHTTTAGLVATLSTPTSWLLNYNRWEAEPCPFRPYRPGQTLVPVTQITPDDGYFIHTFYDECPWSPDGKLLLVTRLPYQKRKPRWNDTAEICVIDIENQTIRKIYETRVWSFQMGSNAQWSDISSRYVYTNDIIQNVPVCVRIDLENGKIEAYSGSKYDIAGHGKWIAGPDLRYVNVTQYGYALPDPPTGIPHQLQKSQMDEQGVWITNLENNQTKLLASMNDLYAKAIPEDQQFYADGVYYPFHTKFNSDGTRIMQVFRCLFEGNGRHASLFTLDVDSENIIQCLPREKWNQKAALGGSGNHPNWHPDGEHIIMNTVPTWLGDKHMRFSMFRYDGSDFKVLSEKFIGSGHPSVDPTTRYLVSDAYAKQTYVTVNGEIPIRLIDLEADQEYTVCTISNNVGNQGKMYSSEGGSQFKLDPHPAWSRDYRKVCFNGAPNGHRQVFIADLTPIMA